jgi:hypothetical protein
MATKKTSKSTSSKATAAKSAVVPPAVRLEVANNPTVPVKRYLMSIGVRADHIDSRAVWAKGKGLTVATVSQWRELFESF